MPDLSRARLVLCHTCHVPDLSCARLVLSQTCPVPDLSCARLVLCQTCPVPDLSRARLILCRLVLCQTARTRGASVRCQTRADMRVSLCEPCRSMCIPEGREGHHALMPFSSPTEKR